MLQQYVEPNYTYISGIQAKGKLRNFITVGLIEATVLVRRNLYGV